MLVIPYFQVQPNIPHILPDYYDLMNDDRKHSNITKYFQGTRQQILMKYTMLKIHLFNLYMFQTCAQFKNVSQKSKFTVKTYY